MDILNIFTIYTISAIIKIGRKWREKNEEKSLF